MKFQDMNITFKRCHDCKHFKKLKCSCKDEYVLDRTGCCQSYKRKWYVFFDLPEEYYDASVFKVKSVEDNKCCGLL